MRFFLALMLSLCLQGAAVAGGGGGAGAGGDGDRNSGGSGNRFQLFFNLGGDDEEEEDEDLEDDPRAFFMPAVVAPLSRDGRLTGFAYVQMRVRVADGTNVWSVQDNVHYALDRLVRAAYRTSLSAENGTELDPERAVEVWTATLREYYGANAIDSIIIANSDTRLLSHY